MIPQRALPLCLGVLALLAAAPPAQPQARPRYTRLVELLDQGKVVFGSFVDDRGPSGGPKALRSEADFLFYDLEHQPFDVRELSVFLQFMLDPADIVKNGPPARRHPVLVRIPANGREMNQWMIKNILDQGAHGIVAPHVETAEQALNVVKGMRYPRKPGSAKLEPEGQRGSGAGNATRYWGLAGPEYREKAGLWPYDDGGELVSLLLIENGRGVENAAAIARVPGVGIVSAAPGDLSSFYEGDRALVEEAIQKVLAACKGASVPCAITAGPSDVEKRIQQGFRVLIGGAEMIAAGRKAAGR